MNRMTHPLVRTGILLVSFSLVSACSQSGDAPTIPPSTSSSSVASSEAQNSGSLEGTMTISPACPVMKEGDPCLTTPEMYAARPVTVYDATRAIVVATLIPDENGKFSARLAEGTYVIDVEHQAVGSVNGAPTTVVISSGQTVTVAIDIDSGIR